MAKVGTVKTSPMRNLLRTLTEKKSARELVGDARVELVGNRHPSRWVWDQLNRSETLTYDLADYILQHTVLDQSTTAIQHHLTNIGLLAEQTALILGMIDQFQRANAAAAKPAAPRKPLLSPEDLLPVEDLPERVRASAPPGTLITRPAPGLVTFDTPAKTKKPAAIERASDEKAAYKPR